MKKYIIDNADKLAFGTACIKQPVHAMLVLCNGTEFFGSNEMKECGITTCPRVELNYPTGEGYHHCKETCKQNYHAEVSAIMRAKKTGMDISGSTMYLTGHYYCCDNCTLEMKKAGVKKVIFVDTKETLSF